MGRPSIYTPELLDAICARREAGEPLAGVCRDEGMPAVRTFLGWANEKEEVATAYALALAARAAWAEAEHERIRLTAVDRDTAAAARVQLNALEWQMAKMAPTRYGDRVDVNVDANIDLASLIDRGRQRVIDARRADALLPPSEGGEEGDGK